MKTLWVYLKPYRTEAILAPLFKMIEACFELIVPLVVARMVDVGVAGGDVGYVWRTGGVLLALGVAGLVISMTAQYLSARAGMGFGTQLRTALFHHVNTLSYRQLDALGAPTLVTRLSADSILAQNGLNRFLRLFLRAPFIVLGALVASFFIDWRIGLVYAGVSLLLGAIITYIIVRNMPRYTAIQQDVDEMSLTVSENLEGVRVIRAFCNQPQETARFEGQIEGLKRRQSVTGRLAAAQNPLTQVLVNLALILLLWQGRVYVEVGQLTQGEITALVNYMFQILHGISVLSTLVPIMAKGVAGCKRIADTLAVVPEGAALPGDEEERAREESEPAASDEAAPQPAPGPLAEWRGVRFRYHPGADPALDGVDLQLYPGQHVGVIGGTGSGKSTLVNLLLACYPLTEGQIYFRGREVGQWDPHRLRAAIGVVPQRCVLFRGTIADNLAWGNPAATPEQMEEALELACARDFVQEKGGLQAEVEEEGRNFSGGQRQRLCIARALVRRPALLVLDDSLSALDYATEARVRKNLAGQGVSVLCVGQRVALMKHMDRILVLDQGKCVGQGTHAQLLSDCPVYREICHSQLSEEEL